MSVTRKSHCPVSCSDDCSTNEPLFGESVSIYTPVAIGALSDARVRAIASMFNDVYVMLQ